MVSNQQEACTLVKLYRVLCTVDWEDLYPNCLLQSLASNKSDHCPLYLGLKDNFSSTKRCHFKAFWPQLQGFKEVVATSWNAVLIGACPGDSTLV
jgi:hypothetical protein